MCIYRSQDITAAMNEIIGGLDKDFQVEIKAKQTEIDTTHAQLRESTLTLTEERRKLEALRQRSNEKSEMEQKCQNLTRAILEENSKFQQIHQETANGQTVPENNYDPDLPFKINPEMVNGDFKNLTAAQSQYLKTLPSAAVLQARVIAYQRNEENQDRLAATLRGRSLDLEASFKKVVALCAGVEEDMVDTVLEGLLQAVESDPDEVDTARVNSFLRKVEEAQAGI